MDIKCIVFDLDNTLWKGTLLEGEVQMSNEMKEIIKMIDEKGIIMSISSKGDEELALKQLKKLGIEKFFLHPQINWEPKSRSILKIADELRIGTENIVFVDDDYYEIEEVYNNLEIRCIHASNFNSYVNIEINKSSQVVTKEARNRRLFYISDIEVAKLRNQSKSLADFYEKMEIKVVIEKAILDDFDRILELSARTNKLNTNGDLILEDDLYNSYKNYDKEYFLKINFRDRLINLGIIGFLWVKEEKNCILLKQIALSCRIINRSVAKDIMLYIAKNMFSGKKIKVIWRDTKYNIPMKMLLNSLGIIGDFREPLYLNQKINRKIYIEER